RKIFLIMIVLTLTVSGHSCSSFQQAKRQEAQRRKQFEKEKEQRDKEAEAAYEEAIQRHYAIQDKATKKMMKQTAKKSQMNREHKKDGFFKRLFTPRQKKAKSNRKEK
ncbi:MAG TPA: hypothetical protein PLL90_06710, partial [Bacteroidales bacterium]|nr:hypothetical protein [Bacteroidales bacterium]